MSATLVPDDDRGRAAAVEALRTGAIVALPTDTVYGLAVGLDTPGGIERLFHVKHRPPEKGIVLLLDDAAQAALLGDMSLAAEALAAALWPGGLTIVVRRRTDVALPDALTGGAATIGLRVPDHDAPRALARGARPAAGHVGQRVRARRRPATPPRSTAILGDAIELILDGGPARGGPPSTVVDCSIDEPRILRPGAVDAARSRPRSTRWASTTRSGRRRDPPDGRTRSGRPARVSSPTVPFAASMPSIVASACIVCRIPSPRSFVGTAPHVAITR